VVGGFAACSAPDRAPTADARPGAIPPMLSFAPVTDHGYVAFGTLFSVSGEEIYWIGRRGSDHLNDGELVKISYELATRGSSQPVSIIRDPDYDLRGGAHGLLGDKVYNFSARYRHGTGPQVDFSVWSSTDGVTGEAYGPRSTFVYPLDGYTNFNFYNRVVPGPATGEYWISLYQRVADFSAYRVQLHHTQDSGGHWEVVEVYAGDKRLVEASLLDLGDGKMLVVARHTSESYLAQMFSEDYGKSWSDPVPTRLCSRAGNCMGDLCKHADGSFSLVFADRGDGTIKVSRGNRFESIARAAPAWQPAVVVAHPPPDTSGRKLLGYPSMLCLGDNDFLISFSVERSPTRADLLIGRGRIRTP
jgi:hypothetical protein